MSGDSVLSTTWRLPPCKSVDITRGGQLSNADTWGCHCLCAQVFSYGKCEGWSCHVQPPCLSVHHIYNYMGCLYGLHIREPQKCAIVQTYSIVYLLSLTLTDEQTLFLFLININLINPIPVSPISSLPKISQNFFLVSRTASSPWWVGLTLCKLRQPLARHITRFI